MSLSAMNAPTVIYVGTDKAGSSWLYELFSAHPEVFVPKLKDVYFFDRYWDRGVDWYASFFAGRSTEACSVEICHDYLYSRQALERIRTTIPDCRILIFLREPVARTKSAYGYAQKFAPRPPDSLRSFAADNPSVVDNSRYAEPLGNVLDIFPATAIGVFFYEDLKASPQRFAASVCDFLDLAAPTELPGSVNAGGLPRWPMLVGAGRAAGQWLRGVGLERVVSVAKSSSIVRRMKSGSSDPTWTVADLEFAIDQLHDEQQKAVEVLLDSRLVAPESIPDEWLPRRERVLL